MPKTITPKRASRTAPTKSSRKISGQKGGASRKRAAATRGQSGSWRKVFVQSTSPGRAVNVSAVKSPAKSAATKTPTQVVRLAALNIPATVRSIRRVC